jgi:DNA-binding NarL/FixJ family response regulator
LLSNSWEMIKQKYKVIIVDDSQAYIDAVKTMLELRNDLEVIGEANDGIGFLDLLRKKSPDLVLMDINMPGIDGLLATKLGLVENWSMKILGITMSDNPELHLNMLQLGFSGGILKNNFTSDFDDALKSIFNDGVYFPLLN